MAYVGRSSAGGGTAMGFEDAEHMLTALRQPLFIQAPLQAMLESMVDKLQSQAAVITGLQDKLSSLERTHLDSTELLARIKLLESRVSSVTAGSLSPFNQAELMQRVTALEARAGQLEEAAKQATFSVVEGVEPRLALCEQRLAGAHNLAGRLMAVDAVAAELGIDIPQPQLSSITQLAGMQAAAAATGASSEGAPAASMTVPPGDNDMWKSLYGARVTAPAAAGLQPLDVAAVVQVVNSPAASSSSASGDGQTATHLSQSYLNVQAAGGGYSGTSSTSMREAGRVSRHSSSAGSSSSSGGGGSNAMLAHADGSSCSSSASAMRASSMATVAAPAHTAAVAACSSDGSSNAAATLAAKAASAGAAIAGGVAPATPAGGIPAAQVHGLPSQARIAAGVLTRSKQQELQQQIDLLKEGVVQGQQQLGDVQKQVEQLRCDAASSQDQALSMMAGLADGLQGLTDRLELAAAQLRKEMKPALQQAAQVSLSDFTALASKVDAAAEVTVAAGRELQNIKTKELPALSSAVSDLSKRLGRGPAGAVSDVDKLLAGQLGLLQEQLSGLAARLDAREAAELEGQGVATRGDLQELSLLMVSKASKDDMKAVLGRAVDLALEAYRSCMEHGDGSGASRSRCLVCDRALLDRSNSPPHTAPAGPNSGNLPLFDQFRPSTAACSSSSSNTGRPIGRQAVNGSQASSSSPGPVSENYTGPCAASEAVGVGPLGPGLSAAQLRRLAEERLHGGSGNATTACVGAGASPGAVAVECAGSGELGEGLGSLFARGSTPGTSCSVRYSSPGPYDPNKQRQRQQQQVARNGVAQRPHTTGGIGATNGTAAAGGAGSGGATRPSTCMEAKQQQQPVQAGQKKDRVCSRRTPVFL